MVCSNIWVLDWLVLVVCVYFLFLCLLFLGLSRLLDLYFGVWLCFRVSKFWHLTDYWFDVIYGRFVYGVDLGLRFLLCGLGLC